MCFWRLEDRIHGQIVITQTPASLHVNPGDTVTIRCKASSSMSNDMQLYQFIPGQNPKLLIYDATSRFTGTPDRFSGSYSGTDFTFTINGVRPEDEGEYYCVTSCISTRGRCFSTSVILPSSRK
uniref:Ig-like domain-containing protein n=1 Tax=Anolis carolinensis TaxID=28377 RepID=A0A803T239_ANOCA